MTLTTYGCPGLRFWPSSPEVEPQIQQGGRYLEYRRVLRRVVAMMGIKLGVQFSESEMNCLVDTIGSWPVFPDTRDALRAMKRRYNLAIISNVDDDLFAPTADALEVELDVVVTAQQCGSYKPDHRNFRTALERMGIEKDRWLHIGESLYHDIAPANELGIASVWVNRGHGAEGGATRPTDAKPDLGSPRHGESGSRDGAGVESRGGRFCLNQNVQDN